MHTNADMCALAVREALDQAGLGVGDLGMLAAATTQGDYLVPGHATAVHAELGGKPIEIASFQSVCASSLMAAKAAWLSVRAGEHDVAAACAGEFSSRWFRPHFYEGTALVDAKGRLRPEADFLRFTLSDGAGAIVIEPTPRPGALRIRFVDIVSLAEPLRSVHVGGRGARDPRRPRNGWSHAGPRAAHAAGALALLQDFELLKRVIRAWVGVYLQKVDAGRIVPAAVDWLLVPLLGAVAARGDRLAARGHGRHDPAGEMVLRAAREGQRRLGLDLAHARGAARERPGARAGRRSCASSPRAAARWSAS